MSPFEVNYGRKNIIRTLHLSSNTGDASPGSVSDAVPEDLEQNMSKFEQNRRKIRRRALKSTERCMKRMSKSRGNPPPSVYNLQDKVLVRVSTGPRFSKRYAVILGIVVKRNADLSKYKVKFRMLGNPGHQHIKWFAVCDVTSITREREKQRSEHKARKHQCIQLLQSITHGMRLESFGSLGFRTRLDPNSDGSCQFAAMVDQLASLEIFRSATSLRQEIVSDQMLHPLAMNGIHLSNFVEGQWHDCAKHAAQWYIW